MKLFTTRFGEVTYPDDALLTFPSGLQSLPSLRRFALLKTTDLGLFRWLQSAEVPALACLVCNPRLVLHDYAVRVPSADLADIHVTTPDDCDLLVLLTQPLDPARMTADLQRPIVCNRLLRLARQIVLPDAAYSRAHLVFSEDQSSSAFPPDHPLELTA